MRKYFCHFVREQDGIRWTTNHMKKKKIKTPKRGWIERERAHSALLKVQECAAGMCVYN